MYARLVGKVVSLHVTFSNDLSVIGILLLKQMGTVASSMWQTNGINWTIPYYATSVALNLLVTTMIVGRLLCFRARLNRVTADKYGSQYTSIVAILVESAALYSSYVLFLIPFALGPKSQIASIVSELFPQSLPPVQASIIFILLTKSSPKLPM
jgi:hypothetical protein